MNTTPSTCKCAERISRAEASLRAKGWARPELAAQYFGAATEFAKTAREHFSDCSTCQAIEAHADTARRAA